MKPLFKIVALVLLAIWLPATNHCDLEAAGVSALTHGEAHTSDRCADACSDDACHALEGVSFLKTSTADLRVLPPLTTAFSCLLSLLIPLGSTVPENSLTTADTPELQALHRTWQFVRRTALPACAPNFAA